MVTSSSTVDSTISRFRLRVLKIVLIFTLVMALKVLRKAVISAEELLKRKPARGMPLILMLMA